MNALNRVIQKLGGKKSARRPRNRRREFTGSEEECIIKMRALAVPFAEIARCLGGKSEEAVRDFCQNPPERLKRPPQAGNTGMMSLPMSPSMRGMVEYVQVSVVLKGGAR